MNVLKMWKDMSSKQKRQFAVGAILGVGLLFLLSFSGPGKKKDDVTPPSSSVEVGTTNSSGSVGALVPLDTTSPIIARANMSYALSLVYTYTPESARQRFADFLRHYVDPSQREDVRLVMDRRLTRLLDANAAQLLEENELHFLPSGYQAVLKSRLVKYDFATNAITSSAAFYLRVEYRYFDGNLYLLSMNTIGADEYTRIAESLKY